MPFSYFKLGLLLLTLTFWGSCQSSDTNTTEEPPVEEPAPEEPNIETYTMTSFVAFMPSLPHINYGDILYHFNWDSSKLVVEFRDAAVDPSTDTTGINQPTDFVGPAPGLYLFKIYDVQEVEDTPNTPVPVIRSGTYIDLEGGGSYLFTKAEDGSTISLNSNTDPRLSGDGPVMTFERFDPDKES